MTKQEMTDQYLKWYPILEKMTIKKGIDRGMDVDKDVERLVIEQFFDNHFTEYNNRIIMGEDEIQIFFEIHYTIGLYYVVDAISIDDELNLLKITTSLQ